MLIKIEDKWLRVKNIENVPTERLDGLLPLLTLEDGTELYVAASNETAGEAAKGHYKYMATNDPTEFACIVGTGTLVTWGLGDWAGPGANQYRSLAEWLDGVAEEPENHFACDGADIDVDDYSEALQTELGFQPSVAYLHNGELPNDVDQVVINVDGGVVQDIYADNPQDLKITLIDWDVFDQDREKIPTIQEINAVKGGLADCTVATVHPLGNMSNSLKEAVAKAR